MQEASHVWGYVTLGLWSGAVGYGLYMIGRFFYQLNERVDGLTEDVHGIHETFCDMNMRLDVMDKKLDIIEDVIKGTRAAAVDGILDRIGEEKITAVEENPELIKFNKSLAALYS
jgi:hypothetical protein